MPLKQKIEEHPIYVYAVVAVSAFIAGFAAYGTILHVSGKVAAPKELVDNAQTEKDRADKLSVSLIETKVQMDRQQREFDAERSKWKADLARSAGDLRSKLQEDMDALVRDHPNPVTANHGEYLSHDERIADADCSARVEKIAAMVRELKLEREYARFLARYGYQILPEQMTLYPPQKAARSEAVAELKYIHGVIDGIHAAQRGLISQSERPAFIRANALEEYRKLRATEEAVDFPRVFRFIKNYGSAQASAEFGEISREFTKADADYQLAMSQLPEAGDTVSRKDVSAIIDRTVAALNKRQETASRFFGFLSGLTENDLR